MDSEVKIPSDKPRKKRGRPRLKTTPEGPSEESLSSEGTSPQFLLAKLPRPRRSIPDFEENVETESSQYVPRASTFHEKLSSAEAKKDHLFIKGIKLEKNLFKGRWEISEINTNKGKFTIGSEQNDKLSQQVMQKMSLYLRSIFESDLEEFLSQEDN